MYLGFNDGFVLVSRSGLDGGGIADNSGSFSTGDTTGRATTCTFLVCGAAIPQGALVGRIGSSALTDFSTGFVAGANYSAVAAASGRLYLGFNDGFVLVSRSGLDAGGVADNTGAFTVTVTKPQR